MATSLDHDAAIDRDTLGNVELWISFFLASEHVKKVTAPCVSIITRHVTTVAKKSALFVRR